MITIEPLEGLCNRMRVLDSAIQLSKQINKALTVVWNLDCNLNCRFEELFITPKTCSKIKNKDMNNRFSINQLFTTFYKMRRILTNDKCLFQKDVEFLKKNSYKFDDLKQYGSIFISTYTRFFYSKHSFDEFIPVANLRQIIMSYVANFDEIIGVHIRRTDSPLSEKWSPIPAFIECMNREIEKNHRIKFFVATDSPAVEGQIKKIYGERIISHKKKTFDRSTPLAIKDALIDLYCLSECQKLLGSYWSSFSETAAQLKGIEFITVTHRK